INNNVIDSERSDECIDLTMMCVLDSERSDECIDFTMIVDKKFLDDQKVLKI
ncbi:Uncharacterized protein FWK35_00029527, partial [Aphis craccivora]